jgi:hypothetical protein
MLTTGETLLLLGKLAGLWAYEKVGGAIVRRWGTL